MHLIRVEHWPGERHAVLLRHGEPVEYWIDRPAAPDGVDDLHVGRVVARVPAMAGAFVALEAAEGFLPDSAGGRDLTEGAMVRVRVTRTAQGGKGPRLARAGTQVETGPVRRLEAGPDALAELQAAFPAAPVETGFSEALRDVLEALAAPVAALPAGMRAHIVATPALTAIDLDSGAATAARAAKPAAQYAANLAALPALAREISLRNLGGAILLDMAGIPAKQRRGLQVPLEEALAADRGAPRLAGFSHLGFAEILRPRRRPPLHEKMSGPHAAGLRALRAVLARAEAAPYERLALRAAPPVAAALQADKAALAQLDRQLAHAMVVRSDPALAGHAIVIETRDA